MNKVGTVPLTKAREHMYHFGHDLGQMLVGPVIRDGNAKISANLFPIPLYTKINSTGPS